MSQVPKPVLHLQSLCQFILKTAVRKNDKYYWSQKARLKQDGKLYKGYASPQVQLLKRNGVLKSFRPNHLWFSESGLPIDWYRRGKAAIYLLQDPGKVKLLAYDQQAALEFAGVPPKPVTSLKGAMERIAQEIKESPDPIGRFLQIVNKLQVAAKK